MSKVRVRFAPSPTGFFHIGSARTALFNWLYARHTGGDFVLRIEDTDAERNTEDALQLLLEGMRWLGLNWDEGPDVGGDYGPYFQSERGDLYKEYLQKLLDKGRAYEKDGAVFFKLEGERYVGQDPRTKEEVEMVKAAPQVIDDAVRGRVERAEQKDFVIFRKNGQPVFHFVNVVDDIAMGITHVIRGEDHLSNTSKHCELFKAFDAPLPQFAHIPLILKSSGKGKMSKRDTGSLVEEYERRGFLAEALRNYLCLLGWSPKDDREILDLDEIIRLFDLPGINRNNARFDEKKLSSINTHYLRELPLETFCWMGRPVLASAGLIDDAYPEDEYQRRMSILQEKLRAIEDLPGFADYLFKDEFDYEPKGRKKTFKNGDPVARLKEIRAALETQEDYSEEALETMLGGLVEKNDVSTGKYIHPTRFALSGTNVGPSFYGLLSVLGKEKVLERLDSFLAKEEAGEPLGVEE